MHVPKCSWKAIIRLVGQSPTFQNTKKEAELDTLPEGKKTMA